MNIDPTLLGVFLGFVLAEGNRQIQNRRRNKGNFRALRAEIKYCKEIAEVYRKDGIAAPLYRLPTKAYEASLPQLLADSAISEQLLSYVQRFYMETESLNRGLDLADSSRDNKVKLEREYNRNLGKASYLTDQADNDKNYFSSVINALNKKC